MNVGRDRHVLMVSYHYPPSTTPGSLRVGSLARRLAASGWRVTVVTGTGAPEGDAAVPTPPNLTVIRTSGATLNPARAGHPVISRPLRRGPRVPRGLQVSDAYDHWKHELERALEAVLTGARVDVVFSSSPPHSSQHAIARHRARRHFKWVADFRDPWTHPHRRRVSRYSAWRQRRMELEVLLRADRIVANTAGNRDALLDGVPKLDPSRVVVIPNGFESAAFTRQPGRSRFDLTYVGEVYPGMFDTYAAVLATLHASGSAPSLEVFGVIDPRERRRLEARGLAGFVTAHGFVPHEQSIDAMCAARALLVLLPRGEQWRSCIPSKLYWYLGARRPVIGLLPDGDAAALIRRTGAGWPVMTGDRKVAEAFARALASVASWQPQPAGAIDEFELGAIAARVESVLEEVAGGTAR